MEGVSHRTELDKDLRGALGSSKIVDSISLFPTKIIHESRHIVYILLAASAIGQGARMLYQGIFAQGTWYAPNGLDLAFDWGLLFILGAAVLVDQLLKVSRGVPA